jgi:hypothetical protein
MNVSTLPGIRLKLTFEFEAELEKGFDDAVMRTVRENCSTLKIVKAGFEE